MCSDQLVRCLRPMSPLHSPLLALRCLLGGVLMGLANLVPGISGGTMLLASGVYLSFVDAIADITAFRWSMRSFATLAVIGAGGGAAILLGAGLIRELVESSRWAMYSVFIGLTLGGIPLLWSLVQPWRGASILGCLAGLIAMALLAMAPMTGVGGASNTLLLMLAGLLGGAAMVLPGLSGAYLLLILGQYVLVLAAVESLQSGAVAEALPVLIPAGVSAVVGVVGVSNIMRWLLRSHPHPTHGFLLGLLAGAVFGLWPFAAPRAPQVGEIIRGQAVTQAQVDATSIEMRHWPLEHVAPSGGQLMAAFGLILAGFAASAGIGRLGSTDESTDES